MRNKLITMAFSVIAFLTGQASATTSYLPGFTWNWEADFGQPNSVAELPPNPNSDARSRALAGNAGLSAGPQVGNVWQYGNAPYVKLQGGTFVASDFAIYQYAGLHINGEGVHAYFWADSLTIPGNWDAISYTPDHPSIGPGHFVHPDDSPNGGEVVMVRWEYPGQDSALIHISGKVWDIPYGWFGPPNDGVDFYLLKNSSVATVDYAVIPDWGSHLVNKTVLMNPGDSIFMGVGPLGNYGSDSVMLDVTFQVVPKPPLLGDLNGDGWVGQTDLNAILADWGHSPPLLPFSDPSGDGLVSQDDLDTVLTDWGRGIPPVPEPATLSLLALGGLALIRRKRK